MVRGAVSIPTHGFASVSRVDLSSWGHSRVILDLGFSRIVKWDAKLAVANNLSES